MLTRPSIFPDPESADHHGLVAVSHEITADLLLDAYAHGIFPWSEDPVGWFSPDPRAVFVRDRVKLPKRLGKIMRRSGFSVTFDTAFAEVMRACAESHAAGGTWITSGFFTAYGDLHLSGHAHSVEVWADGALAGGLYGVQLGGLFAGESMFFRVANASKVAFAHLVAQLDSIGTVLIDAQVPNPFTTQLGAVTMRRRRYLELLRSALEVRCRYDGTPWPAAPPAVPDPA
jgi:leucyl/phenylalanyl-tRNA---protein transferase